jgi:CBS domain-containing protein
MSDELPELNIPASSATPTGIYILENPVNTPAVSLTDIESSSDLAASCNVLRAQLTPLAESLASWSQEPLLTRVRDLVEWSGYRRRRGKSEQLIEAALDELGLVTTPDFRDSHISGSVVLSKKHQDFRAPAVVPMVETTIESVPNSIDRSEHILKVGRLEAANRAPKIIAPASLLEDAIAIMLKYNYSQLPVMSNERTIKGMVSWQSIARFSITNGKLPDNVSECMDGAIEVSYEAALFDAMPTIIEKECVLVRKPDNKISGIITPTDLSIQFKEMSEAFIKIGQIETILRIIIEAYYPNEIIRTAKDPLDEYRIVSTVDDLTFGEYKRLFENSAHWTQHFKAKISRRIFIETLEEVRIIRNDVMHFDPDGIEDVELEILSTALNFFVAVKDMAISKL